MPKRKVTFSLENDIVESLKMMATLTSQEQSGIVTLALEEYFQKLGAQSGKSSAEFISFMKEARTISDALRPAKDVPPHSQLPGDDQ